MPLIGTIVGTRRVVAGLVSAQISGVNTRIDDLRTGPIERTVLASRAGE